MATGWAPPSALARQSSLRVHAGFRTLRLVDIQGQRVAAAIRDHKLIADRARVVVAVSGGIDSMVLLHCLHALSRRGRWKLIVAHLNHRLRGRNAARDQKFVARASEELRLPFVTESADVEAFAAAQKLSLEMAARQLRHDFLARVARTQRARFIALAHHADDQVELFFLRLFRGAGAQGLGGMDWSSPSPADASLTLVRPLLAHTKADLLAFGRTHGIAFREDATNASLDILRNRIRHKLLPMLRPNFAPHLNSAVLRTMELLRDENDFVAEQASRWRYAGKRTPAFAKLHIAVQRRVVQMELLAHGIVPEFAAVERLRTQPGTWHSVHADLVCCLRVDGTVETRRATAPEFRDDERRVAFSAPAGHTAFGGAQIRWRFSRRTTLPKRRNSGTELFDAAAVGDAVVLRHWRRGDRFQPIGTATPRKLQNLFTNEGVSRERRHDLIVATTKRGDIFWVEGLRIGEGFKLTPQTKRALAWTWSR